MFLWENFNLVFEEIDIFDKKVVTTMIQIENLEIIQVFHDGLNIKRGH